MLALEDSLEDLQRSRSGARFEGFQLDLRSGELRHESGRIVRLPDQPCQILTLLMEHSGQVVSREELRKYLWPNDTIVEFEHSISAAMNRLRQALGDSAENPRYIETLARRGYRWMPPVEWIESEISTLADDRSSLAAPKSTRKSTGLIGKEISHYRIVKKLGSGGMGAVYKAEDTRLGRFVALKFLAEPLAGDTEALKRFQHEARAASALEHPGICTIYDIGEHAGLPFIVMQFLEGQTLDCYVDGKPLPLEEILNTGIQIADALAAAHARGIIHRDIKPSNIFVTLGGRPKILDFGVAKLTRELHVGVFESPSKPPTTVDAVLTAPGAQIGTFAYMSPEQERGEELDARTDLFSFGLVLYDMATGWHSFSDKVAALVQSAVASAESTMLRRGPEVPAELGRIISKATEVDRKLRYQSATEMQAELEYLKRQIGSRSEAIPAMSPRLAGQKGRRPRRISIFAGLVTVALLGVAGFAWDFGGIRERLNPVRSRFGLLPVPAARVMLAVLPFQNLSNDAEQEYFSDGLTEETITDLGQLSPSKLGVIARTSAMAYKHTNKTAAQIGQELGVDYLLEGSVRREDKRVRISAQLIRAKDQTNVWAQSYDRDLRDFLAVQNELGESLAQQVQISLNPEQKPRANNRRRIDPEAYDDYLRGQYAWNQFTVPSLRKSMDYFQQAIDKDPGLAQAYAGLAQSYGVLMDLNKLAPAEAYLKSEAAARKAVELDPQSSEAHAALGWQLLSYDRDFSSAKKEFQSAVDLNPSSADAHDGLANCFAIAKQFDRSLAEATKARELDPLSLVMNFEPGKMLFYARRYDQAIRQLRFSLDLHPNAFPPHYLLQLVYQAQGRYEEAYEEFYKEMIAGGPASATMAAIEKIHATSGWKGAWQEVVAKRTLSTWDLAGMTLALGERQKTMDLLNEAASERLSQVIYLNVDPRFDSIRSDPEFQDLVKRLGLPP